MKAPLELPKGVLRFLLERMLPPGIRGEAIRGDLLEEYWAMANRSSPREARAWYRRQSMSIVWAAARGRLTRGDRGLALGISWLDVKLGLRMLVKHPGLTLVAVFALAVGIPVGLAPMHLSNAIESSIPEDTDGRVRSIRYWDPVTTSVTSPTYYELDLWRGTLASFEALGASRSSMYNVDSEDGRATGVIGAAVTASSFGIVGTLPLVGRALDRGDELIGAPEVVVLGQDLWESRFGGDPTIVGRTIRVSRVSHTVVGVMPSGFLFPGNAQVWLPLREEEPLGPGQGTGVRIFGRLADGVSPEEAEAEVRAVGMPEATALPETLNRVQAEVVPFGFAFIEIPRDGFRGMPEFYLIQALAFLVLLVACGNVAMLIFARTATRFRELAIRTALGAGRIRIVSQIFAETLVLAVIAAGVGVVLVDWILGRVQWGLIIGETVVPYWFRLDVTREAVVGALILAVVSATVAGIVPAVRITGKKIQENISRADSGPSGIRFGGVTSALIVADVAIAVAVVGMAVGLTNRLTDATSTEDLVGIPAEEFLAVEVRMPITDGQSGIGFDRLQWRERLAATQQTLVDRLRAEPGVRGIAVADALPRMDHRSRQIAMDDDEASARRWVRTAQVDVEFFTELDKPILSGRGFDRGDLEEDASAVIVNSEFVNRVLDGRDPVGRRVRFASWNGSAESGWYEIVGVVGHLGTNLVNPQGDVAVYVPAAPGEIYPLQIGIHLGDSPEAYAPRIRELVAEVDPTAVLSNPVVLSEVYQGDWYLMVGVAAGLGLLVIILVTLAASGIYAIMSFSVSERTREIGIRTALGAGLPSLVFTILKRSLAQIAAGALLGLPLAAMIFIQFSEQAGTGSTFGSVALALVLATAIVTVVGLFSCLVPTRRALRIEVSQALRES